MKIGMIGLGRMGADMSKRLLKNKISVVVYDKIPKTTKILARKNAIPAFEIKELVEKLGKGKKVIWLMLPSGPPTNETIKKLLPLLKKGDIIIDGANDFYKNAEKHSKLCKKKGVHFFDCGVSGGIWGLKNGYTLMVGGPKSQFKYIKPFCKALAPKRGYGYFGPTGSGHYVKSIHNIIEYTGLQGIAEGVELLKKFKHPINISKATEVWMPSSVIKSWLLDLTNKVISKPEFKKIGTNIGSVTIQELQDTKKAVNGYAPAFDAAVKIRKDKTKKFSLGKRVIAAVRKEFGGHKTEAKK